MIDPPDERFRPDFLDAAREGLEPTAADRARLRRSIAAQIVGIATVTATTVGASAGTAAGGAGVGVASAAAGSGLVAKVVVGVIAVSLAVGLGAMLARDRDPAVAPMTVAVAEAGASIGEPARVALAAPIASGSTHEATEPAATAPPAALPPAAPSSRPASSKGASEGELTLETRLLASATEALRSGDPRAALTLLDEHRRRFPRGVLNEERDASRVFALCAMGSEQEAIRSATQFAREHPRSGLGPRVARACAVR